MLRVRQFEKFLSEINPQATPVRQALHNYIRTFHELDEQLSPELFNSFFDLCLEDPHWLRLKAPLSHEVQTLIKNFTSFYQTPFSSSEIKFPEVRQVIEIENMGDYAEVVQKYAESLATSSEDHVRVINDQNKRFLILILRSNSYLQVHTVNKKFTFKNGQLQPSNPHLVLQYTPQLELDENFIHRLEVSPQMVAQFTCENQKFEGVISRGYVFQKFQAFQNSNLNEVPRLFWALKRIEQFFISRETDSFYQEMTRQLEKISQTPDLSAAGRPSSEATQIVSVLLGQAESALENIYRDDKKLDLLIKEVKKNAHLKSSDQCLKISPKKVFDLTN